MNDSNSNIAVLWIHYLCVASPSEEVQQVEDMGLLMTLALLKIRLKCINIGPIMIITPPVSDAASRCGQASEGDS